MSREEKTEKLYYDYVSDLPFKAVILDTKPAVDGKTALILDKTILYPEGGGQPGDRGTVNGVSLLDVRENEGEILHLVSTSDARTLKPGPAELILAARRRRELTALHTGQHLLSATLLHMLNAPTVSMHMGDEYCTIDVDIAEINDEALLAVEEAVAEAIEENSPVVVHLCPPEDINSFPLRKRPPQGEDIIRIVEIKGHDCIACCGTHLKSTGEIGLFRIMGAEKYKGMNRISFLAGRRLLDDCRLLRQNAVIVSRAISVPVNDIGKGVLEYIEKTAQMEKRLKALELKVIQDKADTLLKKAADIAKPGDPAKPAGYPGQMENQGPALVVESYAEENINEVLSIGKIVQKQSSSAFVLVSEQDLKFASFCQTEGFDLRLFLKALLEAHGGKGGGNASFFQGSFGTREALNAFLQSIKTNKKD